MMTKVATPRQMAELDRRAIEEYGIPGMVLMERAALGVATKVVEQGVKGPILILCGSGNNGGDGLAVARILTEWGCDITPILMVSGERLKGDAKANYEILRKMGVTIQSFSKDVFDKRWELIIDALLGTGLDRELTGDYLDAVMGINDSWSKVIAVDIPSGISGDTGEVMGAAVKAHMTVTFAGEKPGLLLYPGVEYAGEVMVADIGMPNALLKELKGYHYDKKSILSLLPTRKPNSHKGNYGHILVVGGSKGFMGAGALCCLGAVRSGAGLVTWAYPRGNQGQPPLEAMTREFASEDGHFTLEAVEDIIAIANQVSVLAMGPGIGAETAQFLMPRILESLSMPMVIDADGLNGLALMEETPSLNNQIVLTPHPGEMARLLGIENAKVVRRPVACARQLADETGAVIVLKMATTIIAHPDGRLCYNTTGNAGMATGGSGDVLTGMTAALLGHGLDAFDAACLAVFIHGLSGDLAAEHLGMESMGSSDVATMIAEAYQKLG